MAWTAIPDLAQGDTFSETNWDDHIKGNLEYIKGITDLIDPDGSPKLYIDEATGQLGIGTPSPDAKLRIDENDSNIGLKVTVASSSPMAYFQRDGGGSGIVKIQSVGGDVGIGLDDESGSTGDKWAVGIDSSSGRFVVGEGDDRIYYASSKLQVDTSGNLFVAGGAVVGPTTGGTYNGNIFIDGDNDPNPGIHFRSGSTTQARIFGAASTGDLYIDLDVANRFLYVRNSSNTVIFTLSSSGFLTLADDLAYTPSVLADWDGGADPGGVFDALDQLAERVKDLEP